MALMSRPTSLIHTTMQLLLTSPRNIRRDAILRASRIGTPRKSEIVEDLTRGTPGTEADTPLSRCTIVSSELVLCGSVPQEGAPSNAKDPFAQSYAMVRSLLTFMRVIRVV
jgi:hypothetical protein